MTEIETNAVIEMLEAQRNAALKGEALTFGKLKAAEARIESLSGTIDALNNELAGNDDGRIDTESD